MSKVVIVPDLQIPLHDQEAVERLLRYTRKSEPGAIFAVGDEWDAYEVSRFDRGTYREFGMSFEDSRRMVSSIMGSFAAIAPLHISRSNHGDRLDNYLMHNAPALFGDSAFTIEALLGYAENPRITFHREPFLFAPGWALLHGDEKGFSQVSGQTARKAAEHYGTSVLIGHTHRQGWWRSTAMLNGEVTKELHGIEVGHLMDVKQAHYLGAGAGNWQKGFAILEIRNGRVYPQLVPLDDRGRFFLDGKLW